MMILNNLIRFAPKLRQNINGFSFKAASSLAQIQLSEKRIIAALPTITDGTLTCRLAESGDRSKIIDFMVNMFATREPLMKCMGASAGDVRAFVEYHVEECLVDKASFIAVDNDSGQLCGVRLNGIGPSSGRDLVSDFGPNLNTINKFLAHVEEEVAGIIASKDFMRHVAICVKPEMVKKGVATELMSNSSKYATQHSLTHMVAICSGHLPYKLAEKIGFKKVREILYGSYEENVISKEGPKTTVRVIKPFASLADTHYAARLMVKPL